MKKLISIVIAAAFMLSLAACSNIDSASLSSALNEILPTASPDAAASPATDDAPAVLPAASPAVSPDAAADAADGALPAGSASPDSTDTADAPNPEPPASQDAFITPSKTEKSDAAMMASSTVSGAATGNIVLPLPDGSAIITSPTEHDMYRVSADGKTVFDYKHCGLPIATDGVSLMYIPMTMSETSPMAVPTVIYSQEVAYLDVETGARAYSVKFKPFFPHDDGDGVIRNARLYDGFLYFECEEYAESASKERVYWTSLYKLDLETGEFYSLNEVDEEATAALGATVCNSLDNAAIVADGSIWCFDKNALTHLTGYSTDVYPIEQLVNTGAFVYDVAAILNDTDADDVRLFGAVESGDQLSLYYRIDGDKKLLLRIDPTLLEYSTSKEYSESNVRLNLSRIKASLPIIAGDRIYYIAQWDKEDSISHSIHSVGFDFSDRRLEVSLGNGKYAMAAAQWLDTLWYSTAEEANNVVSYHAYRLDLASGTSSVSAGVK